MKKNMAKKILTEPKMNYDLNLLQEMYKKMLLIRRFEEKAGQLYGMGQIGGFCHLYIGQEAVVVGIQSAQIDGDSIVQGEGYIVTDRNSLLEKLKNMDK